MKILYSCLSHAWGGLEMYTITAIKQLLKRNIKVELICAAESRIHIEANNLGLIIHPVKASGYFHPFAILKIAAVIRRGEYDVIHTQASKDLWQIVPALNILKRNVPLVLTKQMGSFIVKKDYLHRQIYDKVTKVLAISSTIHKNLLETTPLSEDKIEILYNGIDLQRFNPETANGIKVREEFKIGNDELLIGMLARFSPGKGHEEFLTAAGSLLKKFSHLKFMIVGEAAHGEKEYADKIKKMASDISSDKIIFTGFRSDTPDVLGAMDIFLFPSHAEAFGIALAEAMAMGRACAASNADGVLDLITDGETGLLFENKNSADLERKTELLINSPELRERLGKAAREKATGSFDLEVVTNRVIALYKELIAQG